MNESELKGLEGRRKSEIRYFCCREVSALSVIVIVIFT